jgi:UBX domain-containing protein 11
MSISEESKSKKPIPKKLENDLQNMSGKYREGSGHSTSKRATVGDLLNDSIERAMYDEIIGSATSNRHPRQSSSISSSSPSSSSRDASRSDHKLTSQDDGISSSTPKSNRPLLPSSDFNTSIINRLSNVENELKSLRKEYSSKLKLCNDLEAENYELRERFTSQSDVLAEMKLVRKKNELLQQQIKEMEDFLSDYGLEWVGNKPSAEKLVDSSTSTPVVDYHDFAKKIQELNAIIAAEPTEVVISNEKRARLVNPSEIRPTIKLTFFHNGIMIQRGPFRYSHSESYRSFMSDILDGYYPSELKERYPDGVIFDLIDRHDIDYDEEDTSAAKMSVSTMLDKLPSTVIRNGLVMRIRDEVTAHVSKASSTEPPAFLLSPSITEEETKDVVSISIHWIDGKHLKGKFHRNDRIGTLRQLLSQQYQLEEKFILRTVYPQKIELHDAVSFSDAGLFPNGTIYANRIK